MYVATVSGTGYVGTVSLDTAALSVVVTKLVLQVEVTADGSAELARSFLLGGSPSLGGLSFRFGY